MVSNYGETLSSEYRKPLVIAHAITVVEAGRNDVMRFEPQPNAFVSGVPAVACAAGAQSTGHLGDVKADLVNTDAATAFAIRGRSFARDAGALDCSGLVTLAEAGASSRRDLVLLLVGAVFSFGAALLLEVALDLHRRRSCGARASPQPAM